MAKWEDVVSYAKTVAETAGRKTGEFVEVTKVKMEIADTQRELSAIYEGLGRLVYDSRKSGESADEMIDACIGHLDETNAHLQELEDRVLENRNVTRCSKCGAINAGEAIFCNKCGEKLN